MHITRRKAVDKVLKNHKPFFIDIGSIPDIPVQICRLSANFRPLKLRSRDRAPTNSVLVCVKPPSAPMLCSNLNIPLLAYLSYERINKIFDQKIAVFFSILKFLNHDHVT